MIVALDEFEFQYKDDGILVNSDITYGTAFIDVKSVDGLDSTKFKVHRNNYDNQDGGLVKVTGREIREIKVSGDIIGGEDPIEPLLDDLKANYAGKDVNYPFYFKAPGIDMRQVFCKSLGFNYSWTTARRYNCTPFSLTLLAEDPVIYGTTMYELPMRSAAPMPGHTFNHGFDYSFGGIADPGGALLTNAGNLAVGFTVELTQQSSLNPVITSLTTGQYVDMSISVGSTDVLLIDFFNKTVTLNGQRYRSSVNNEGWFKLEPGQNQLSFVDISGAQLVATVRYYDGYE